MEFQRSKAINTILNNYNICDLISGHLDSIYWMSCTTGHDLSGYRGLDLFSNGFELGVKAGNDPVFIYENYEYNIALFFIGDENNIIEQITKSLVEAEAE